MHLFEIAFFCSFPFPGCWVLQMPQHRQKEETAAGILAQFPPCLCHVTSLSPGTLRALRCSTAAAQLLTLWCMRARENRRQWKMQEKLSRWTFPYFSRTVLKTNKNKEKEKPRWALMFLGGCPNTTNNNWNYRMIALDIYIPAWTASIPLHKPRSSLTENNVNTPSHRYSAGVFIKSHFCQTGLCFTALDIGSEYFLIPSRIAPHMSREGKMLSQMATGA